MGKKKVVDVADLLGAGTQMLSSILKSMGEGEAGYERRKVANDEGVAGLRVSTAFTDDCGYETAIIDEVRTHIVERYPTKKAAAVGHAKWLKFALNKRNKIITDVGYGGVISSEKYTLKRKEE